MWTWRLCGAALPAAGVWRCLPVAVKTQVFERWDCGSDAGGEGELEGGDKARGYVRAIMETAISASVGHPNVVRGRSWTRVISLTQSCTLHSTRGVPRTRRWPRTTTTSSAWTTGCKWERCRCVGAAL